MTDFNRRHVLLGAGAAAFAAGLASTGRAAGSMTFTVTIRNVATDMTLKLPHSGTSAAPIAQGVFVVSSAPHVLFTPGMQAPEALERLAEDGNFQPMLDKVTALKGLTASGMFLPGQPFTFTASPGDKLQFATCSCSLTICSSLPGTAESRCSMPAAEACMARSRVRSRCSTPAPR